MTDPGSNFDLGAEELGGNLVSDPFSAILEDGSRRVICQVSCLGIDQKILFLDSDCKAGVLVGTHGLSIGFSVASVILPSIFNPPSDQNNFIARNQTLEHICQAAVNGQFRKPVSC
jgi:hypothetical protein